LFFRRTPKVLEDLCNYFAHKNETSNVTAWKAELPSKE
jgi:hypothetical protein